MALSLHQANDPALIQAELAIVFSHRNTALAALHLLCELKGSMFRGKLIQLKAL
jgi:hypothetical protein